MIKTLYKLILFVGIVISFISTGFIIGLFCWNPIKKRQLRNISLQFFCRRTLKVFDISVDHKVKASPEHSSHLIISNHMSYVDVFVIAAHYRATFVTSKETQEDFLLGLICKMGGCVFVERRNIRKLYSEIEELSGLLDSGINLVIFPEATSSNGSTILPFKRALLEAAFRTQRNILPLCLNIVSVKGQDVGPNERDSICYYGNMTIIPHATRLMKLSEIQMELIQLPELDLTKFVDSKALNEAAYQSIKEFHRPLIAA